MDKYNELLKTLENYRDIPNESGQSVLKQTAEAIEELQSVIDEKQKLLAAALDNLSKCSDCKYCSNVNQCSTHSVERNLAYGGCGKWQWTGAKTADIAS